MSEERVSGCEQLCSWSYTRGTLTVGPPDSLCGIDYFLAGSRIGGLCTDVFAACYSCGQLASHSV